MLGNNGSSRSNIEGAKHLTASRASGRLLLAEDDSQLSMQMKRLLQAIGWQVDTARDGVTALSLLRLHRHDVMLLDMCMPGMNGLEVLRESQTLPSPPAVVMISGFLDVNNTLAALESGAIEVLEKPVPPRRLRLALQDAAETRSKPPAALEQSVAPEIIGTSPATMFLQQQVASVAQYRDMPVMIVGETGTGKELVAQALHRLGGGTGKLVSVNCAALPESLLESELFGHEAGAFTGARTARVGLFEAVGEGTIFLDEVGEMAVQQQAKLLRVLEERTFRRVGSNLDRPFRARIVSATNRSLLGRDDDQFRSDLYYRLAGYTIRTTPLRGRPRDIRPLAQHFLESFSRAHHDTPAAVSASAIQALCSHDWPGNVRELRSVIQSAAIRASGDTVGVRPVVETLRDRGHFDHPSTRPEEPFVLDCGTLAPGSEPKSAPERPSDLPTLERELLVRVYAECGGNLSLASRRLKVPRSTLRDKLRRYGVC